MKGVRSLKRSVAPQPKVEKWYTAMKVEMLAMEEAVALDEVRQDSRG
jgi:hypothetical protein